MCETQPFLSINRMRSFINLYILFLCLLTNHAGAQMIASPKGKYLNVNGRTIYYEETGTGKPLLLLHGFGRTLEDWKPYIPEFSKTYRVISIDLPGHGRSDLMDSTDVYLHKQAANQIIAFTKAMKLDSLNVIGFSSGAMITLYLATIQPSIAKKIIVIAGQTYYSDSLRKFISGLGGPENFIMDAKELSQLHGDYKGRLVAQQFWNFRKLYGDPSFTPDILSTISAQTLIVHGDNDPAASVENAFTMFRCIPGAHLWIVPFAEHVGIFSPEHQKEFIRQITSFLNRD